MKSIATALASTLLLAASGALYAHNAPAPQRPRALDCSRAADPQQCERMRDRATRKLCAKSEDAGRCERLVDRSAARRRAEDERLREPLRRTTPLPAPRG